MNSTLRRSPHFCRRGLTLIEVLVVIFIVAILAALLLPAILRARASARRAQCASRLHQLGVALQMYGDQNGMLPADTATPNEFSILARLLPQLDQQPLYNSINFSERSSDPANRRAWMTQPEIFLCPSDYRFAPHPISGGWTNYAGNSGQGWKWFGPDGSFLVAKAQGKLSTSPSQFRDGLGQTVAFSEWVKGHHDGNDPLGNLFKLNSLISVDPAKREWFAQLCRQADPALLKGYPKGSEWLRGGPIHSLYNHFLPPNDLSCKATGEWNAIVSASSRHGGGVNVVMMDASTRFLSERIDLRTWRALGTRAGGEIVGEF